MLLRAKPFPVPFLILVHSNHIYLPTKMEQTECSETWAYKIQTAGNYPKESIQQLKKRISTPGTLFSKTCRNYFGPLPYPSRVHTASFQGSKADGAYSPPVFTACRFENRRSNTSISYESCLRLGEEFSFDYTPWN